MKCKARNKFGFDNAVGHVQLGDLERPFMISGLGDDQKVAIGDYIKLECGAIIYNYSSTIVWRKDGMLAENIEDLIVEDTNTKFSWRKAITWKQIQKEDAGIYECESSMKDNEDVKETLHLAIAVHEAEAPVITTNFNQSVLVQTLGATLKLDCLVSGLPVPSLTWMKDGINFIIDRNASDEGMQRIMVDNENTSITFTVLKLEDVGSYRCVANNRVGSDFKEVQIEIPSELELIFTSQFFSPR